MKQYLPGTKLSLNELEHGMIVMPFDDYICASLMASSPNPLPGLNQNYERFAPTTDTRLHVVVIPGSAKSEAGPDIPAEAYFLGPGQPTVYGWSLYVPDRHMKSRITVGDVRPEVGMYYRAWFMRDAFVYAGRWDPDYKPEHHNTIKGVRERDMGLPSFDVGPPIAVEYWQKLERLMQSEVKKK